MIRSAFDKSVLNVMGLVECIKAHESKEQGFDVPDVWFSYRAISYLTDTNLQSYHRARIQALAHDGLLQSRKLGGAWFFRLTPLARDHFTGETLKGAYIGIQVEDYALPF